MEYLKRMNWPGFALYAEHEPVYRTTLLSDLNYQRLNKQQLVFQCENHDCKYRSLIQTKECVVCLESFTSPQGSGAPELAYIFVCVRNDIPTRWISVHFKRFVSK